MKYQLVSILIFINTYPGKCQRAYLGLVDPEFEDKCRLEANISPEQVQGYELESVMCVDKFEDVEAANCYHACILKKLGLYDASGEPQIQGITDYIGYINAVQIENITIECYNSYTGNNTCGRIYYIQKCIDKSIGRYPYGTKHVPIDNIRPTDSEQCRMANRLSLADLCRFNSDTDCDMFAATDSGRCYQVCILERIGYVRSGLPVFPVYRERYHYIDDETFLRAFLQCYVQVQSDWRRCAANYEMYKCLKEKFGEFPRNSAAPTTRSFVGKVIQYLKFVAYTDF